MTNSYETLQAYRAELAPAVVQMLATASEGCPPGAPSRLAMQNGAAPSTTAAIPAAVLHKEAVYAAVGTGAYDLHDFIDFQPWLRSTLVQVREPSNPALQRSVLSSLCIGADQLRATPCLLHGLSLVAHVS